MAAVQSLAISLGVMQVARKIPFDDPNVLTYVRIGYITSQLITLAVYYYISSTVKAKNDRTVLKYVEPESPMNPNGGQLVTTTVRDYDLGETSKAIRGAFTSVAMMVFLHLYMGYTQPLFVQGIMTFKTLYDSKLFKIYVLGKPADGDLKRPFKVPSLFGASGEARTDKAAIEEAEKRIKAKED
ncbi:inorganic phosphate transporter [Vararia minispora EC-137]|uniref:Inorganic phosphate transporter n=1 Tax=Vararia minispora EC-137 TaxID=1314806 RepID=A0ACB8QHK7_9AGAM|nr:inorganic phosphate transporter [Vararia minispora EC-137]